MFNFESWLYTIILEITEESLNTTFKTYVFKLRAVAKQLSPHLIRHLYEIITS